jgi:hypothetical protein
MDDMDSPLGVPGELERALLVKYCMKVRCLLLPGVQDPPKTFTPYAVRPTAVLSRSTCADSLQAVLLEGTMFAFTWSPGSA